MDNWDQSTTTNPTNHYVTVIGYDDTILNGDGTYGVYYYTDTCGKTTGCGSKTDGQIQRMPQWKLFNAIWNIATKQSSGDGGWVW